MRLGWDWWEERSDGKGFGNWKWIWFRKSCTSARVHSILPWITWSAGCWMLTSAIFCCLCKWFLRMSSILANASDLSLWYWAQLAFNSFTWLFSLLISASLKLISSLILVSLCSCSSIVHSLKILLLFCSADPVRPCLVITKVDLNLASDGNLVVAVSSLPLSWAWEPYIPG